jgi:enamine deaminase RidA (YjgF/YER057c/UK114 family)
MLCCRHYLDQDDLRKRRSTLVKKVILPSTISPPRGNYSHGIMVSPGRLLFIAGQTAVGQDGIIVGIGDAYAQAKQVYENIGTILTDAVMTYTDIVKMTTYITDISFKEKVNEVRRQFLKKDFPVNTLVVVKGLAEEEYLVEIEAMAWTEK